MADPDLGRIGVGKRTCSCGHFKKCLRNRPPKAVSELDWCGEKDMYQQLWYLKSVPWTDLLKPYLSTAHMSEQQAKTYHRCPIMSPSVALLAPPPRIHDKSPYARIPLPPMTSVLVTLHPLLRREVTQPIEYLMQALPSSATPTRPHLTHPQWRQEAATCPNLPSMTIRTTWQETAIVVFPSKAAYGFVTVLDVLVAVYRALRAKATNIHTNTQQKPNESGIFDCPRPRDARQPDEGVIRALITKLMQGRTAWQGLSPSPMEGDVWLLHTVFAWSSRWCWGLPIYWNLSASRFPRWVSLSLLLRFRFLPENCTISDQSHGCYRPSKVFKSMMM